MPVVILEKLPRFSCKLQWNGKQLEDMYLVALTHRRDIKSIRELRACHLPLLNNMWENGTKAIASNVLSV